MFEFSNDLAVILLFYFHKGRLSIYSTLGLVGRGSGIAGGLGWYPLWCASPGEADGYVGCAGLVVVVVWVG